ncbi:P-loop NTPase [Kamptonema cortianum]|nr:P-loop NTPase [Geitlerinema splendidum]MDK3155321.1 P-loop NTPase [Kamptonema cortianum]
MECSSGGANNLIKIAITSGKGGVGKTTLTCNLGAALVSAGRRTTVFDADLQLANLDIALGIEPEYNLRDVVNGEKSLTEIVAEGPGFVNVISGGSAIPLLMRAGPKRMGTFFAQLSDLEVSTDTLIFDTGAGIDNKVFAFLMEADRVIVVVSPDPTSVTDAYSTIKTLLKKNAHAEIHVVFNQANDLEAHKLFKMLEQIIGDYLGGSVNYLGNVRFDEQAVAAGRRRKLFVLETPQSKASQDIRAIAQNVRNWTGRPKLSVLGDEPAVDESVQLRAA